MCRESFERVGYLLQEAVGYHGGVIVATPEEVKEYLAEELGRTVSESAIEHFALTLRPRGMAISAFRCRNGAIIMIRDIAKFPEGDAVKLQRAYLAPGAMYALNEQSALASTH